MGIASELVDMIGTRSRLLRHHRRVVSLWIAIAQIDLTYVVLRIFRRVHVRLEIVCKIDLVV